MMGRTNKKSLLLIILVIGTLLFTGCGFFSFDLFDASDDDNEVVTLDSGEESAVITNTPEVASGKESSEAATSSTEGTPTPTGIQPALTVDIPLYSANVDTGVTEPLTATVPKDTDITPEVIVDKAVEALVDRSFVVDIESVTTQKDAIIVSFNKDKAPYSDSNIGYEGPILDAIALSLMDNLSDYKSVIFRIEGQAYVSDHIELDINEAYLTK